METEAAAAAIDLGRVMRRAGFESLVLLAVLGALASLAGRFDGGGDPLRPLAPAERAAVVAAAEGTTVTVSASGCGGPMVGSGVLVAGSGLGSGAVLTNHHLVGSRHLVDILPGGRVIWPGSVVGTSPGLDVTLVGLGSGAVPGSGAEPVVELAEDDPVPGQPVVVAASFGQGFRWVEARVQAVVDGASYGSDGAVLLVDVPTVPGYSGGPVLDRRAQLVGLLRATDLATALSVATPASELSAWLQDPQHVHVDSTCMND